MRGIAGFRVRRFEYPRDRPIGDATVTLHTVHQGVLELLDQDGGAGTGFFGSLFTPLPDIVALRAYVEAEIMPALLGRPPEGLIHAVRRPRGAAQRGLELGFADAVDNALWDLAARRAGLPLFRYLGGTVAAQPVYGSGLCYPLDEAGFVALYARMASLGIGAFKVKVGHRDIAWDLRRLALLRETVGEATVMVDANEAWTVKQTLNRIARYRDAGHAIHWVEDPILRSDVAGLRTLSGSLGPTLLNSGEYLDAGGKIALAQEGGADVVNLHGHFGEALRVGHACASVGVPVTLGNTAMNLGAHLASALPEVLWTEHSFLNDNAILTEPYPVRDGCLVLPETPGHGLAVRDHL